MSEPSYEEAAQAIRAEIAKYHDGEFENYDDLIRDLGIASDDLSVIALSLEKRLGVKLDHKQYRAIKDVDSWARAICAPQ